MEKNGLSEVTKDAVTVDGWEFHKAAFATRMQSGDRVSAELGDHKNGPKKPIRTNFVNRWSREDDVSGKRNGDGLSGKRCQG